MCESRIDSKFIKENNLDFVSVKGKANNIILYLEKEYYKKGVFLL